MFENKRYWPALLVSILGIDTATSADNITTPATPAAQSVSGNSADDAQQAQRAIELARTTLAKQLSLDAATFKVLATETHTWPDASMGCGKPGAMAAQIITAGYIFVLETPKGNYRVHSTVNHAVVCDAATQWRNPHHVGLPLKNLDGLIDQAREDLAKKLNAPPAAIRTVTFTQTEWPDSSMSCKIVGETLTQQTTKGYRIALRYAERTYVYHTDLMRVRACPEIAVE